MSTAQYVSTNSTRKAPQYPFLSQPPPQKKRPTQPLPSPPTNRAVSGSACPPPITGRRRSATTSAVTAWIAEVHPGSPAPLSPRSPSASLYSLRRSSLSRSSGRRPSVTSVRVSSASFLTFSDTPTSASRLAATPSGKDFAAEDLALVGYTSVFVRIPTTPMSAGGPRRRSPQIPPPIPASPVKPSAKTLKHFRSLNALKPTRRAVSRSAATPPTPPANTDVKKAHAVASAAVAKTKKSKYAKHRPPPLATELALAQLMDGGKMDEHITRYAEAQAKAAGAVKVDGQLVGVGDVWRDGEGGIWRDQDEEWEYAHLLGGEEDFCIGEVQWVQFGSNKGSPLIEVRRESTSTRDSDLSMRFAMNAESDSRDDLAVFGGALSPVERTKPGMSVLAIPARNRRAAKHLRKPEFLLNSFPVIPVSPTSPLSPPGLPKTPTSPRFGAGAGRAVMQSRTKARRRPAPLKLLPPSPNAACPTNPADPETMRQDFLEESFAPSPVSKPAPTLMVTRRPEVPPNAQKPTGLKGFFKSIGKKQGASSKCT
ncbi:hypothetical protein K474DRAFT_1774292 [Panus rudis PR-1116 ss-1]|nr:hypothetical protein K474DRAFT_1774292 [Panus rudis PR-1116 ss-1]